MSSSKRVIRKRKTAKLKAAGTITQGKIGKNYGVKTLKKKEVAA